MASKLGAWYAKLADFNVESLFSRRKEPGPPRTVYINHPLPEDYYDLTKKHRKVLKQHVYATNQVITSKYTVLTFLPRNLLEQFRRIANIFFLTIAILQFFSIFSTVSPGLVILPLLIVLTITPHPHSHPPITETVLFVLLQHFKFEPTGKPIAWNYAAVQYPTVGTENPDPELPLKVSLLRP